MSEIKTILNFFDKNNGLDKIVEDLKEIKKLQEAINKQKTGVASDNLKERTAALKEITRLQKQLEAVRKKSLKSTKESTGIQKELLKVEEQRRKVNKDLKVARTEKFKDLQESRLARQEQVRLVKAELKETSKLVSLYDRESAKLNRLRKELKNVILAEGEGSVAARKLQEEVTLLDTKLKKVDASAGQFQRNVGNYKGSIIEAVKALESQKSSLTSNLSVLDKARKSTSLNAKEQDKVQKEYTETKQKLQQVNIQLNQFNVNAKKSTNVFSKLGGSLKSGLGSVFGALGITAGIAGLVRGVGNAINIFKDFEQSNANLAAVLGTTKEDIGALTEDAKRLGATTAFTASEVSSLQTEFAKLGFNEQEILSATEATLSLAAASGSTLSEAAAIAGATLGGFGLEADETQRVVDVMAKSFSTSALDIEKFRESMKVAAPAAAAVGVDIEKTTALLGTLANAGISGSLAGTGLAKSFIQLNKAGLTLDEGLEKVANSNNKLKTAVDLVGVNAAKSFLILAKGTKTTEELEKGLDNAGGAAEKMAKEQLNTLQGSLTILNSAWEGFILNLEDGQGALAKTVRGFVDVLAEILNLLSGTAKAKEELNETELALRETAEAAINFGKVLVLLITSFSAYKAAVLATNVVTKAYTAVTKGLRIAKIALSKGTNIATVAMRVFNGVTRMNPIGALISLVTAATTAFFLFGDEIDETTDSQKKLNDELERTKNLFDEVDPEEIAGAILAGADITKFTIKELGAALEEFQKQQNELSLERTALIAKEGETRQEFEARRRAAFENEKNDLQTIINSIQNQIKAKEKEIKTSDKQTKATKGLTDAQKAQIQAQKQFNEFLLEKEAAESEAFENTLEAQEQEIRAVNDKYFRLIELSEQYGLDSTQLEEDRLAAIAEINKKFAEEEEKKQKEEQKKQLEIIKARQDILDNLEIQRIEDETERAKALRVKAFEDKIAQLEEQGILTAEIEKALRQKLQDDLIEIDKKAEEKRQAEIDKARKESQKKVIEEAKKATDFQIKLLKMEAEARIESLDRQIQAENDFINQNENLSAEEIEFRRKKAAELELERIQEQKRLEKLAKVEAFFELVAAFAKEGDGLAAIGKATAAIATAEAATAGFHDGGYTGDGNEYDSAGIVHKGEFVNTKKQTSEYGMKGWTAKDFDKAVDEGYFNQFANSNLFADQNAKFLSVQNNQIGYDFKQLESTFTKGLEDLKNNMPSTDFEINGEYFIKRTKRNGSTTIKKRKLG